MAQLRTILPNTIQSIELNFTTENTPGHYYHYSHGLRKHNGNCQRIAHGHRSTLEIYIDHERKDTLEQLSGLNAGETSIFKYLAQQKKTLLTLFTINANPITTLNILTQQHHTLFLSEFELKIPVDRCELLQKESTVEHIADYIFLKLQQIKQQFPKRSLCVKAFEGYKKGAVAAEKPKPDSRHSQ